MLVNHLFSVVRRRSWFNQLSADNVVLGLIIANAAIFMLWRIEDQKFMMENFMVSPLFLD